MTILTPLPEQPANHEVTHMLEQVRRKSRLSLAQFSLLSYLIEETMAGNADSLSQKTVAADVFRRNLVQFDPKSDSIVRTTVANLRVGLMNYYATTGQGDAVMVELPKGSYAPRFAYRDRLSPASNSYLWSARVALESRTTTGFRTAVAHLDRVLAEAPRLSIALALKAEALASSAAHGLQPRPALEESRQLAERALESASPAWQAWVAMASIHAVLDWNWAAADRDFRTALERSGDESSTHAWYTAFLVARGRASEAVTNLQRGVNHYGYFNPTHLADLGMIQMLARDFEGAAVTIASALEAAPGYYQHHMNKAILLEARGEASAAVRVLDEAPLRLIERPVTWGLRAMFAGLDGQVPVARRRMLWLRTIRQAGQHVPSSQFAACAFGMGDHRKAIEFLAEGAEERDPLAIWFHAYPFFRHLDEFSEFHELISTMGLIRQQPEQRGKESARVVPIVGVK